MPFVARAIVASSTLWMTVLCFTVVLLLDYAVWKAAVASGCFMIARRFSGYSRAVDAAVIALMIAAACYQSEIDLKYAIGGMRAVVSMYN